MTTSGIFFPFLCAVRASCQGTLQASSSRFCVCVVLCVPLAKEQLFAFQSLANGKLWMQCWAPRIPTSSDALPFSPHRRPSLSLHQSKKLAKASVRAAMQNEGWTPSAFGNFPTLRKVSPRSDLSSPPPKTPAAPQISPATAPSTTGLHPTLPSPLTHVTTSGGAAVEVSGDAGGVRVGTGAAKSDAAAAGVGTVAAKADAGAAGVGTVGAKADAAAAGVGTVGGKGSTAVGAGEGGNGTAGVETVAAKAAAAAAGVGTVGGRGYTAVRAGEGGDGTAGEGAMGGVRAAEVGAAAAAAAATAAAEPPLPPHERPCPEDQARAPAVNALVVQDAQNVEAKATAAAAAAAAVDREERVHARLLRAHILAKQQKLFIPGR